MKLFGKKPGIFKASKNRPECIYGPPEMLMKRRFQDSDNDTEPQNKPETANDKPDNDNGEEQE